MDGRLKSMKIHLVVTHVYIIMIIGRGVVTAIILQLQLAIIKKKRLCHPLCILLRSRVQWRLMSSWLQRGIHASSLFGEYQAIKRVFCKRSSDSIISSIKFLIQIVGVSTVGMQL